MNNKKVKFCYFNQLNSTFVEVFGQISQYDEKNFEDELYCMKLDSFYSQNQFLKPGFSTGHLISSFRSESGIINLSSVLAVINEEMLNDIRTKSILCSYFSKIQIDDIVEYNKNEFNTVVRSASNPIFPQPETYYGIECEVKSIESNTKAFVTSGYNFKIAKQMQDVAFSDKSFESRHVHFKFC